MTEPSTSSLVRKASNTTQAWLDKMPQLENDERRLLALIDQCYNSFLSGSRDLRALAVEFGVPHDVLNEWSRRGKWLQRRDDFRQELLVNVEMAYAEFVKQERVNTAKEIVDNVRPLIGDIASGLSAATQNNDTTAVRRLAEALKHVSDIVSKAAGLDAPMPQSDRPVTAKAEAQENVKPPFFNITAKGPVTISSDKQPEEKTIDV